VEAADYLSARAADERQRRARGLPMIPGRLPNFLAPTQVLPGGHLVEGTAGEALPGPGTFQGEDLWSDIEGEEVWTDSGGP